MTGTVSRRDGRLSARSWCIGVALLLGTSVAAAAEQPTAPALQPSPGAYADALTVQLSALPEQGVARYVLGRAELSPESPLFPTEGLALPLGAHWLQVQCYVDGAAEGAPLGGWYYLGADAQQSAVEPSRETDPAKFKTLGKTVRVISPVSLTPPTPSPGANGEDPSAVLAK